MQKAFYWVQYRIGIFSGALLDGNCSVSSAAFVPAARCDASFSRPEVFSGGCPPFVLGFPHDVPSDVENPTAGLVPAGRGRAFSNPPGCLFPYSRQSKEAGWFKCSLPRRGRWPQAGWGHLEKGGGRVKMYLTLPINLAIIRAEPPPRWAGPFRPNLQDRLSPGKEAAPHGTAL